MRRKRLNLLHEVTRNRERFPFPKELFYFLVITASVSLVSCKREERSFRVDPPAAEVLNPWRVRGLDPGPKVPTPPVKNPYEENAYAMSEGKRLFSQFNCVGCHSHGG